MEGLTKKEIIALLASREFEVTNDTENLGDDVAKKLCLIFGIDDLYKESAEMNMITSTHY